MITRTLNSYNILVLKMGLELPNRLIPIMIRSLASKDCDSYLKNDSLQHILGIYYRLYFKQTFYNFYIHLFYRINE